MKLQKSGDKERKNALRSSLRKRVRRRTDEAGVGSSEEGGKGGRAPAQCESESSPHSHVRAGSFRRAVSPRQTTYASRRRAPSARCEVENLCHSKVTKPSYEGQSATKTELRSSLRTKFVSDR
eukprot:3645855-Pleurochrysis_carterae.AAC.1